MSSYADYIHTKTQLSTGASRKAPVDNGVVILVSVVTVVIVVGVVSVAIVVSVVSVVIVGLGYQA